MSWCRRRACATQALFVYDIDGEDAKGHILGQHRATGVLRPGFWDRARYFGEAKNLTTALEAAAKTGGAI